MGSLNTLSRGINYGVISTGGLEQIETFTFQHEALPVDVEGKVFVSEVLGMSGGILSLNSLAPYTSMPFHHIHIEHEEVYIFMGGQGEFMVDDDRFQVTTGSVVRVAPEGVRCWRNTSNSPLYYAVLQVKAGSETVKNTIEDGRGVNRPVAW